MKVCEITIYYDVASSTAICTRKREIDVYLRPLADEFKEPWKVGVDMFDAYSAQMFSMRIAIMWSIHDFPT